MVVGTDVAWINHVVILGPALAAIIALAAAGQPPWRWYRRDIAETKVRPWWLVVPIGAILLAAAAFAAAGESALPGLASLVVLLAVHTVLIALPEELGWRGYFTRVLLARRSPLVVSLIVGSVWGLWHGPKLMMLPSLFVLALALSVLLTAAYSRFSGGTALAALGHGSFNAAVLWLEPTVAPECAVVAFNVAAGLLAIAAIVLILVDRRWFLRRPYSNSTMT